MEVTTVGENVNKCHSVNSRSKSYPDRKIFQSLRHCANLLLSFCRLNFNGFYRESLETLSAERSMLEAQSSSATDRSKP